MLSRTVVGRGIALARTTAASRHAVVLTGGCDYRYNAPQTRGFKLFGKSVNKGRIRNPPEFGYVEDSDIENKKYYINWDVLQKSKGNDVMNQKTTPLYNEDELTIRRMFECGIHYGHETSMWNPNISQFLYGHRNGIHIFNLEETLKCLRVALTFLRGVAQRGGIVLFVNTRPQFESLVRNTAVECGEYYITQKWVPGIITNRLRTFEQDVKPDVVIFLSMPVNTVGVKETLKGSVPSIGICDSDCDPSKIMYPVPGNDDGIDPLRLYCSLFKKAILDGKANPIREPDQNEEAGGRGPGRHGEYSRGGRPQRGGGNRRR